jgi:hypothetical protein
VILGCAMAMRIAMAFSKNAKKRSINHVIKQHICHKNAFLTKKIVLFGNYS